MVWKNKFFKIWQTRVIFSVKNTSYRLKHILQLEILRKFTNERNPGPRFRIQWNRAILLDESHKLDPWTLDEGPRPKKWQVERLNQHGTILEGKSIGWDPPKKQRAIKESSWLEEPRCKIGSKAKSNSRVEFASNESELVPRNLNTGAHLNQA
jgi:hypothetical protein